MLQLSGAEVDEFKVLAQARVEEQKCWRTASNSVRIANDVLQDTETESAESVSQEEEMEH